MAARKMLNPAAWPRRNPAITNVARSPHNIVRSRSTQCRVIRGTLVGSDTAKANGITVRSNTPALDLCRRLIDGGADPRSKLELYRGDTLALTIANVGVAARLTVNGKGTNFCVRKRWAQRRPCKIPGPDDVGHQLHLMLEFAGGGR